MEISEISIISNFDAGMKCLQTTSSLFSRVFSLSHIEIVPLSYSFWKWGAIILALLATFSSIIKKLKFLIIRIRRIKPSPESLLQHLDIDLDLSEDDEDEASPASSDEEEDDPTASYRDRTLLGHQDFRVKGWQNGNLRIRRRCSDSGGDGFCQADFPTGKNVVKLWDSLGLSLGFDSFDDFSDSESVVSLWDLDEDQKISDLFGGLRHFPAVSVAAPSRGVVLSAKRDDKNNGVVLGAYDTRMGGQAPAAYAEWCSRNAAQAQVVGMPSGGAEKVYVRDDISGVVTIGDMRKMKTALETLTETEGDMWWDADAAIAEDEFVDCSR